MGAVKGGSKAGRLDCRTQATTFCSAAPALEVCPQSTLWKAASSTPRTFPPSSLTSYIPLCFSQQPPLELGRLSFPSHRTTPPPCHPRSPRTAAEGKDILWWFSSVAVLSPGYGLLYEIQMYAERPRVHCKPFQGRKKTQASIPSKE